eukprot:1646570-Amphidinium_carterae.1
MAHYPTQTQSDLSFEDIALHYYRSSVWHACGSAKCLLFFLFKKLGVLVYVVFLFLVSPSARPQHSRRHTCPLSAMDRAHIMHKAHCELMLEAKRPGHKQ